jgi:hypothetical protein
MEKISKKRGRKPKGGKIIDPTQTDATRDPLNDAAIVQVQNVILHLKCSSKDLKLPELVSENVEPYSVETTFADVPAADQNLQSRLRSMALRMQKNDVQQRSDCFWCTCPFETVPVHIPFHRGLDGQYKVYGSFCCPECAAGYLFHQTQIDHTSRFERYHLLNYIYGAAYEYKKNITPAPPPFFLLNKYYGTLTIEEYRALVSPENASGILVLDKPICMTYPEIGPNILETPPDTSGYRLCRKTKAVAA